MKLKDTSDGSTETQPKFRPFRSEETEQQPSQKKDSLSITRRDLYFMSFLGFLTAGILLLGVLFLTGAITWDAVIGLSGEEEVVSEETTAPVIDSIANETTNETIAEAAANTTEEEVVVEEEVVEESDPCGSDNEIILVLDDPYEYNGREIEVTLASDFSAQISVGGVKGLVSVDETVEINGLDITLVDGSEADGSATIYVNC